MSTKLSYYRYYCPSPSERLPCPVGYFCPVGVSKRIACPFNSATCASTRASNPNKPALFILLFLVVFGIFFIYRWCSISPHIIYLYVCLYSGLIRSLVKRIFSSKESPAMVIVLETFNPLAQSIEDDFESNQTVDLPASFRDSYYSPIHNSSSTCSSSSSSDFVVPQRLFHAEEGMDITSPSFSFEMVSQPLTISFKGLNLLLKKNRQKLLTNVSGVVKHHEITALMGPSGAGKLILLLFVHLSMRMDPYHECGIVYSQVRQLF